MKQIRMLCLVGLGTFPAMLGGCGTTAPIGTPPLSSLGAPSSSATPSTRRDLLYATAGDSQMFIYTYPRLKRLFVLYPAVQPETECSDRRGDVFVATGDGLMEYRHAGVSPIATIGIESEGCSVDPVTGNLAVVQYGYGIRIFRPTKTGWHLPVTRTPPFQATSCAYDDHGNLFADGSTGSTGYLELAEMPKGTRTFASINVDQPVSAAGSVQWDGKHLAVTDSDASPPIIYRYSIGGSAAALAGTTKLSGATEVGETWIFNGHVVAAVYSSSRGVGIWKYPGGGSPVNTISLDVAGGVTISI